MEATRLYPSRNNIRKHNSFKYAINCQKKVANSEDTKDWLKITSMIDTNGNGKTSEYKIFIGELEKKEEIVAKIGTSNKLEEEYKIGKILESLNLPTFIDFICMFHCLDDIKSLNDRTISICKKEGDKINLILMPYLKIGRIDKCDDCINCNKNKQYSCLRWNRTNFDVLKNVLKHCIASLFHAYKETGFIHGDLHLGNVMLEKTRRKKIDYGEFGSLECFAYIPVIMDYDASTINKNNIKDVYEDINRLLSLISNDINVKLNIINTINIIYKLQSKNTVPTKEICEKLFNSIDTISIRYLDSEKPPMPDFSKGF